MITKYINIIKNKGPGGSESAQQQAKRRWSDDTPDTGTELSKSKYSFRSIVLKHEMGQIYIIHCINISVQLISVHGIN